jgi:hypothetical protein
MASDAYESAGDSRHSRRKQLAKRCDGGVASARRATEQKKGACELLGFRFCCGGCGYARGGSARIKAATNAFPNPLLVPVTITILFISLPPNDTLGIATQRYDTCGILKDANLLGGRHEKAAWAAPERGCPRGHP